MSFKEFTKEETESRERRGKGDEFHIDGAEKEKYIRPKDDLMFIINSSLPKGRSLACKFSNCLGFQLSSSYPHMSHLIHHRSCPFLAIPLVSFLLFFSTNFIRPSPLITCPIQFLFLSHVVFIKLRFSFMELSTCSFVLLSIQLTFPILLHTHISKAFKRFVSFFLMVHVSHPYRTTGHTSVLTNLFLRSTLILLFSSSFLLLNASFAIPILVLTSSKHLPSYEINETRYLNLLTCSTL